MVELSKKTGIPLVCTNDIHYLKKEDAEAQDVLMLINTGSDINDAERLSMKQDDFSMKSPAQMEEEFKEYPEALANTQRVSDMCNLTIELGKIKLPVFPLPEGKTDTQFLEELCYQGLEKRYGKNPDQKIIGRLKYEISVIEKTGFAGYFLIVQDFVNWAKQNRIVVGPGRGSAGGSIVAYLTGITNVDPLKHNLLFERFLNPERISMPDIDLDFADRRRDEVIKYVGEKYGRDHVAQIITFGTMAARAVIRDVGRALQYTYSYCDQMAKMIPMGMDLAEALEKVDEFKEKYETDPMATKLIDLGKKLEGVARHASTHACGVVISANPLTDSVPLQRSTKEGEEGDMPATKTGIMAKENRKYLYIGGATLLVFLAVFYVVHSNSVAKRNDQIAEKATKAISEINEFVLKKDYVNALEKSEAFVREFKDSDVPEVKKNAEKTEISIKGITQQIEREKEGKSRLADLQNKKSNATPDQYEDLIKEFNKFMTKYGEFSYMFEKAKTESKDLEAKVAAKQEEEDNKIYSELMAEIKPMVDGGKIDDAITHLKKYWDNNKLDKRLQGALKKKLSELKSMK